MSRGLCAQHPLDNHCAWDAISHAVPAGAAPLRHFDRQEILMQWTTPQALDFRFGFEITMYVAAR
ncbi:MAG TPA: pyrroloquinoline quinone precursor peptide PqqA [Burkholderiaceae bacterium]|nr:pyrroloquinoline quinone precursor peptide PqqA [Burkholderiaceae bacterium]